MSRHSEVTIKLSEEQIKHIKSWLKNHWKTPKLCIICESDKWSLSDTIYLLNEYKTEDLQEKHGLPVIALTCSKCGYTFYLNLIKIGIIKPNFVDNVEKS